MTVEDCADRLDEHFTSLVVMHVTATLFFAGPTDVLTNSAARPALRVTLRTLYFSRICPASFNLYVMRVSSAPSHLALQNSDVSVPIQRLTQHHRRRRKMHRKIVRRPDRNRAGEAAQPPSTCPGPQIRMPGRSARWCFAAFTARPLPKFQRPLMSIHRLQNPRSKS